MPASDGDTFGIFNVVARRRAALTTGKMSPRLVDVNRPADSLDWEPALVSARFEGLVFDEWVSGNVELVRDLITDHAAVLFTGMSVDTESFGRAVSLVADAPLADYLNRSTPRTRVNGQIFTSTEYSADLAIPMHSEQSYTTNWPLILGFWCTQPATEGGATPLARTDRVLEMLPAALVDRFETLGVCYERWYHRHLDLPWQEVFQTNNRSAVHKMCAATGIDVHWEGELLRTRQVAQATLKHRGRRVWFNQASLFHPAALEPSAEEALRLSVGDQLPRNAHYGDLSSISADDIAEIREAFSSASWHRPWDIDDVLLIDNLAVAHGRMPFRGERRVLVAMAGSGQSEGKEQP